MDHGKTNDRCVVGTSDRRPQEPEQRGGAHGVRQAGAGVPRAEVRQPERRVPLPRRQLSLGSGSLWANCHVAPGLKQSEQVREASCCQSQDCAYGGIRSHAENHVGGALLDVVLFCPQSLHVEWSPHDC